MTNERTDGVGDAENPRPPAPSDVPDTAGQTTAHDGLRSEVRIDHALWREREVELLDELDRMRWRIGTIVAATPPLLVAVWFSVQPWESILLAGWMWGVWQGTRALNRRTEIRDHALPRLRAFEPPRPPAP